MGNTVCAQCKEKCDGLSWNDRTQKHELCDKCYKSNRDENRKEEEKYSWCSEHHKRTLREENCPGCIDRINLFNSRKTELGIIVRECDILECVKLVSRDKYKSIDDLLHVSKCSKCHFTMCNQHGKISGRGNNKYDQATLCMDIDKANEYSNNGFFTSVMIKTFDGCCICDDNMFNREMQNKDKEYIRILEDRIGKLEKQKNTSTSEELSAEPISLGTQVEGVPGGVN